MEVLSSKFITNILPIIFNKTGTFYFDLNLTYSVHSIGYIQLKLYNLLTGSIIIVF